MSKIKEPNYVFLPFELQRSTRLDTKGLNGLPKPPCGGIVSLRAASCGSWKRCTFVAKELVVVIAGFMLLKRAKMVRVVQKMLVVEKVPDGSPPVRETVLATNTRPNFDPKS